MKILNYSELPLEFKPRALEYVSKEDYDVIFDRYSGMLDDILNKTELYYMVDSISFYKYETGHLCVNLKKEFKSDKELLKVDSLLSKITNNENVNNDLINKIINYIYKLYYSLSGVKYIGKRDFIQAVESACHSYFVNEINNDEDLSNKIDNMDKLFDENGIVINDVDILGFSQDIKKIKALKIINKNLLNDIVYFVFDRSTDEYKFWNKIQTSDIIEYNVNIAKFTKSLKEYHYNNGLAVVELFINTFISRLQETEEKTLSPEGLIQLLF